ncbi:Pyruvate/ketoisovalerate oxidoreductase [Desulfosarcina cetonica]|uniref:indolepyruvate oxidoreductase subunit beta n=1 Tax=Desulfosarcina cetonica TaxID=90730 RepID=UPI0006D24161|nr:indolepyruvate oxidoreductase subunit beta [Desulfosarcina cetonica]VTR70402.1 Pyruvate/ketoisovalerate oxidoreductase [Desulfosarcina cetonica]
MKRENTKTTNVLVVGTGGQGVITASEILSDVAMFSGFDTKKSEIHGMSQRGGVVTSHVRYSEKVYSPMIMEGEVDILLSFELAETVRWMHYLKPKGRVIANLQQIIPPAVYAGMGRYPEDAVSVIRQGADHSILVDAQLIAKELGNPRLVNTILLGIASAFLDLSVDGWKTVIANRVPPKFKELNIVAFDRGRGLN